MAQSSFVLIPGAGGMACYWHRVVPLLEQAGCEAVAVNLPAENASKGLRDYADIVIQAIGTRSTVVLVAQSLGGFTAPLVGAQDALRGLILVNAMIPLPGETAGAWWGNTGAVEARIAAARAGGYTPEFDLPTSFCTTSRRRSSAAAHRVSGSNPIRCSASPASSSGGQRCRSK